MSVWVSYPLKQGLKPKEDIAEWEHDRRLSQLSIKTRIETNYVTQNESFGLRFESAIH